MSLALITNSISQRDYGKKNIEYIFQELESKLIIINKKITKDILFFLITLSLREVTNKQITHPPCDNHVDCGSTRIALGKCISSDILQNWRNIT